MSRPAIPCEHGTSKWKCKECVNAYQKKRRTLCSKGHQFDGETGTGRQRCLTCHPLVEKRTRAEYWAERRGTHCKAGHERTPENYKAYGGKHRCVPCHNARVAAWKQKNPDRWREISKRNQTTYRDKKKAEKEAAAAGQSAES